MKQLAPIGRVLYGLPFIIFGINHLVNLAYYMDLLTSFLEGFSFTIILTGMIMIITGISVVSGYFTKISAMVLAAVLFLFILGIHVPNFINDPGNMPTMINALKDISLMGGSLMIAGSCKDHRKAGQD